VTARPLRHIDLYSDAGRLEALYRDIQSPEAVAVVCHPHPLGGGTLHNKVVFRAAKGLETANVATLRFNFRGVGKSGGTHDEGRGELRDFAAALNWLRQQHPDLPVLAGGFSFGSWVASRAACDVAEVDAIFLIGAPINKYDFGYLSACAKPKLFLHGTKDEHGDAKMLEKMVPNIPNSESVIVTDADHFFTKQIEVVEETMRDWAVRMIEAR
jgi:hypothetical protein